MKPTQEQLKKVYRDVLLGYTEIDIKGFGRGFVKHLSTYDSVDIDEEGVRQKNRATSKGVPTAEEQMEYLKKEQLWSSDKDSELAQLKSYKTTLTLTKKKLYLQSELEQIKKEILESDSKIERIERERRELIGITAESYAEKKVNEFYISHVLRKDKDRKLPFFTQEEYEDVDDKGMANIVITYNETTKLFKTPFFKRIALSSFMSNSFHMCDNNPYFFFGKPIIDLTFFQIELFSHAAYFKHVMGDAKTKPPEELLDDPEELIEWYESSKNAEEVIEKMDKSGAAGGSSLVGATKKDLERLGLQPAGSRSLSSEAAKRGGKLSMEDFIEIHGE